MLPQPLKGFGPLMQRADRLRIGSIEHVPPVAPHPHQPDATQHSQMFRHRGLLHSQGRDDVPNRPLLERQIVQNVPPARFRYCIERIRRGSCSWHGENIYAHIGICQAYSCSLSPVTWIDCCTKNVSWTKARQVLERDTVVGLTFPLNDSIL
jgi:hypothetical protein